MSLIPSMISKFPSFIQADLQRAWDTVSEFYLANELWENAQCPWSEAFTHDLITIWSRSDYIKDSCERYPHWLEDLSKENSALYCSKTEADYRKQLLLKIQSCQDEASLMLMLREFRRAEMLRLIWRDLLNVANLEETLADVSALADVCVSVTLDHLYEQLIVRYGVPMSKEVGGEAASPQRMIVLGMGKHGAKELNVSSDIDLIFAYPASGLTDHPKKPIENHLFFTRLAQKLIHVLDHINGEGFVFRVDMRLRPYGSSGALALNFSAFEDYYYYQGREWERYAMIKARVVAGDVEQGLALLNIIRPFVYRKYADFTSFQALRDMKRMIKAEVHRKGGEQNIKLGQGGIREIEFIAQACQLIYGGRDASLQHPGLMPVFTMLKESGYLPQEWVDTLVDAYRFLRNMEHAIQGFADKQTQLIPDSSEERERISWSLSFSNWSEAELVMLKHRAAVSDIFDVFLQDENGSTESSKQNDIWLSLWRHEAKEADWVSALSGSGFEDPSASYHALEALHAHRMFGVMSADSVQRFECFLPMLLNAVVDFPSPSVTLARVLEFVSVILGRTVYLVLLYENPNALKRLCYLCSESPWISEHLVKSPVILDELLDERSLYQPPNKKELQDELRQQLLRIPEDDLETQMDCLRVFRQSHMLRVAASELGEYLPLMKVSDYLTWLAEVLLEQAVSIAWNNMTSKYGCPQEGAGEGSALGFAVVGYGKLGGIELGYSSDLDMVFLYDSDDHGVTNGDRQINNQLFYVRLGQRVIHILSTHTTQGELYETDMRLRPSGNSGMLVTSLAAFEKYQRNEAWTWEHQALVRARFITGDANLGEHFNHVRKNILTTDFSTFNANKDAVSLIDNVVKMRCKMKLAAIDKFGTEDKAKNDIKQGDGGLIDIEFITQYGVLQYASQYDGLLEWTDNVRLLEALANYKCFGEVDITPLAEVYRKLRSALHKESLADDQYEVSLVDYSEERLEVMSIWQQIFEK
jgi:glutamate-ammonia-ligase adenylyltransferase